MTVTKKLALVFSGMVAAGITGVTAAQDVPFVPTPMDVVDEMLEMANVHAGDVVYDLGSGDGRIVVRAAQRPGVRAVGVESNPQRIEEAWRNARRAGVGDRVRFIQDDLFSVNLRDATVVTLYLLPEVNRRLQPRLLRELRPGARIVSHAFDMGDWQPDRASTGGSNRVYLWIVPARVAGTWQGELGTGKDARPFTLRLEQQHQKVRGTITLDGADGALPLTGAILEGDELKFSVPMGERAANVVAKIGGETLDGGVSGAAVGRIVARLASSP